MASEENRSVNEVVLNGESIISTRKDTVAEDNLVMDETATNKAGEKIKGELDVASADETYNINDPVDDIADEDYIPFNDVSDVELPKKKTLFSTLIEKLTNYFLPTNSIGGKSQLKFNDSGVLDLQVNDIDASKTNNNVSSNHYPTTSNVLDKAKRIIMRTEAVVNPNGQIGWKAYVRNYDTSGNEVGQKGMQFHMNKSGKLTYQIDDARAFREAIGTMDVQGSALPSGTVIDDYHTASHTGVYYFADDGVAGNITTLPEAVCGKLIVANNGNGGFTQYYLPNHSVKFWIRVWWSNAWTAWTDIVHNHTYDVGAEIPANADLNTYTTKGVYQCELTNTARTLSNTPYTGNYMYAFKLIVMDIRNSTNKMQLFIPYMNSNECIISYRFTDSNGSSWTPWQSTAKVYGETANSRPAVTMMVSASNNKRGLLRFNQVENHLRHNFNDGTLWATEQTLANIDDISPSEIGLGYALATTSGSAITATITDFKLRTGVIVAVKIEKEMTTACTLNINNTGAKNIKYWNNQDPTYGKPLLYGGIFTFIYDGTYYRVLSFDRTPSVGVQTYVADTSGNILLDWGYDVNRAQIKFDIGTTKLLYNYYKNSSWRGDRALIEETDGNSGVALLRRNTTTAQDYFVGLRAEITDTTTGKTYGHNILRIFQDHQATPTGHDVVLQGGGNTFIGSGEGAIDLYGIKKGNGYEELYLLSDAIIHLESNAGTIANRQGFRLTTGGALLPEKAEVVTDNFGDIGESSHKLANLWVYKINGSTPVTADNVIVSNQNIGSSSAIDSLDDIPLNTAGRVNITASLSPCGVAGNYTYIYYGISNDTRVIELTRTNHSNKNTEEKWYQANNGNGWTGWMPLSRQGTYVGTCATAANQRAKEATVDADFSLKKGVRVAIKFSNTNTYSSSTSNPITLNVNGTGAKNIWYNNTHSGAGNTGTYTRIYGVGNRYVFYIYDGTYWVWDSYSCDDNSTNFLRNDTSTTLTASGAPNINVKSSTIDITQANNGVESTHYPAYIIQDKNGRDMSRLETVVETNGQIRTYLQVCNYNTTSASHFRAGIYMYTNKSQDMWYGLSNPHNFHRELGFGYGTCSTAADQRVKVVSMSRFRLVVGGIIGVKFSNTNTYSATAENKICLNVNGTGEKPIYYNTGYPTGTNTTVFGLANRVHYYMYDGANWCWLNAGYEADTTDPRSLGFGYGTCDTAEATIAKVVTLGSYTLRTGGYVTVKFTYAVPANATMNINSRGAKDIYYRGSAITAYQIKAGDLATFIYDGTRYHLIGVDRDNYLKINYSYADSTGTPSSSYVTEKVSEVKLPEFKYVVEGDVVCLSVALWWDSAATTYPSGSTKLFKLNYAPRQLMFWLSDKSNVKGYINTDGTFYIRGNTINAGTYAYVQITFLKSGA